MSDLIISDAEYVFAEKALVSYLQTMRDITNEFIMIVIEVSKGALVDQIIFEKLTEFILEIQSLDNTLIGLMKAIDGKAVKFIETIDDKDSFVY